MKKTFVILLVLILAFSTMLVGCGKPAESTDESSPAEGTNYEWSLSCEYSADNHQTKALQDAAEMINELTDGHIKITVYPNCALGDYTVVYGQVMTGDIEMAACPISSTYDLRTDILAMPFLSSNFDEFATYYFKGSYMWDLYEEITSGHGVKLLGFFNSGFMGLGAKKVDSEDFVKLTDGTVKKSTLMRCPPADVYLLTMENMGYNTTTIPYSDLYSAMQSGLCDGWIGGSGLVNYDSFRDAISYFIDCNCINESIPVMMNAELFNSVPEDYQNIIVDVFDQMQNRVNQERKLQEEKALVDLEEYGIKVIKPTEEELNILRDEIRAIVWPAMTDTLGQEVIDELCKIYNVKL